MNSKAILGSALVLALATAGGLAWRHTGQAQATAAAPRHLVKVALATVQKAPQKRAFAGVGELEAVHQVLVSAEIGGRVTAINFSSGQQVRKGDVLVTLNDAPEQAERLRLKAQLDNARTNYRRVKDLLRENAATQEQLDNALAARDMAQGELARTEAVIAQKAVRAPFDGRLGIRRVNQGQYLNVGDPVVSLIDTRSLYVNFSLEEQLSAQLRTGQAVEVRLDAFPDKAFTAHITAIDPLIGRSRTVQVQATLAKPDARLSAGMYASVQVARPDDGQVLTVPETAVAYTAYGDTVFVARHDAAADALVVQRVAVRTGERQAGRVVIEQGLREDDQVVVSGQLRLSDGAAVQATEDTLQAPASGA
ncbi:efflux RND transporter periplasmic adaptor subunit [Pseudomonas soli]|uniref:Efflux transporter periplasmic adaptor subunit n=1 Tax=Pseudomonas soli TaxID=1306993 RepID=A0A2V4I9D9_9PSED|nr:efflux RND transporter periplasmic adaptor subunit [Pseudomonas soli]PYB79700.1 efflux transporter periplasmic adaptor subunit [Pseudomonas soli]